MWFLWFLGWYLIGAISTLVANYVCEKQIDYNSILRALAGGFFGPVITFFTIIVITSIMIDKVKKSNKVIYSQKLACEKKEKKKEKKEKSIASRSEILDL